MNSSHTHIMEYRWINKARSMWITVAVLLAVGAHLAEGECGNIAFEVVVTIVPPNVCRNTRQAAHKTCLYSTHTLTNKYTVMVIWCAPMPEDFWRCIVCASVFLGIVVCLLTLLQLCADEEERVLCVN